MAIKDEFFIKRQGKRYVLYMGLLDEAHQQGLSCVDTQIIQEPTDQNGQVAIVKATVEITTMDDEAVVKHRSFSGIGDASPQNVSKHMVTRLLAMAETRAKARAMRDGINVGVTAYEELKDDQQTAHENGPVSEVPPLGENPKRSIPNEEFSAEHMAQLLSKHMLEHGWSSDEISAYEESHKPLVDHTEEDGRKLWVAVKAGMKP